MNGRNVSLGFRVTVMLALASLSAATVAPARAAGKPQLQIEIDVQREVVTQTAQGTRHVALEPAVRTQQGDVLVYVLRYRNVGDAPAMGASLVDPVPVGTELVRGSATGADGATVTYSTDGKTFGAWPQTRVDGPDGRPRWVDAPAAAVRHLRWTLAHAVPPGGTGEARFKVIVR